MLAKWQEDVEQAQANGEVLPTKLVSTFTALKAAQLLCWHA